MKPLLRAVLILDALLLLAFGLLFLLTPWTSLYNALQLVQTEPTLVGQGFGIALIGLAWLALHASLDGALTTTVAKVVGHVNWLTGLVMLVWLLGLRTPSLSGFGQIVAVLAGTVLLVVGLGGVRLSGAVRRRDRQRVADAAAAGKAERQAAKDAAKNAANRREPGHVTAAPVYHAEPAVGSVAEPVIEPIVPGSVARAPVYTAAAEEAGLTAPERAERAELAARSANAEAAAARAEAHQAADDAAAAPRPPLHG
jgi:hypothetical protein